MSVNDELPLTSGTGSQCGAGQSEAGEHDDGENLVHGVVVEQSETRQTPLHVMEIR